ncbi:MAG TPA: CPBP family intramembrane glutamic endopeptidase [Steroidobacteraceae bacterium]|nr:CPBP family intramembrane glutamic endopeptidase [Steroidobacteraceae bacterium]
MRAWVQKLSPIQEAVVITTIFVGWFIYSAMWIVLAGFPTGTESHYNDGRALSLVVFECAMFAIGALVLRWRGWKATDFLFAVTWRHVLTALGLLVLAALANLVVWQAVGSRLDDGSLLTQLAKPGAVSFGAALLMSCVNGTFEEFFLCRYLVERFRSSGAVFAVTLSAGIRMLYHVYQGPQGTLAILAFGIIIGTYYWRTRALGAVVLTHVLADLFALSR